MVQYSTGNDDKRRRGLRQRTVAVLPTLLTLGNLICGFISVFLASRPTDATLPWNWTPLTFAALMIFLGMVFDGLDGRVARMTHQTSDLGEQLDSMADMVTFGVAPAFMAAQLVIGQIAEAGTVLPFIGDARGDTMAGRFVIALAAIYVACAALRLARFNIELEGDEPDDHMSFKGLPSPGAGGAIAAMVLLHEHLGFSRDAEHWLVIAIAIGMVMLMGLTAWGMVSQLRYPHVLNRYVRGRARFRTVLALVVIILLALPWLQVSLAVVFGLYAVSAPVAWVLARLGLMRPRRVQAVGDDDLLADEAADSEPIETDARF